VAMKVVGGMEGQYPRRKKQSKAKYKE